LNFNLYLLLIDESSDGSRGGGGCTPPISEKEPFWVCNYQSDGVHYKVPEPWETQKYLENVLKNMDLFDLFSKIAQLLGLPPHIPLSFLKKINSSSTQVCIASGHNILKPLPS